MSLSGDQMVSMRAKLEKALISIEEVKGDYERAHVLEDELHQWCLELISTGEMSSEDCAFVAKMALKTKKIDFVRYCA